MRFTPVKRTFGGLLLISTLVLMVLMMQSPDLPLRPSPRHSLRHAKLPTKSIKTPRLEEHLGDTIFPTSDIEALQLEEHLGDTVFPTSCVKAHRLNDDLRDYLRHAKFLTKSIKARQREEHLGDTIFPTPDVKAHRLEEHLGDTIFRTSDVKAHRLNEYLRDYHHSSVPPSSQYDDRSPYPLPDDLRAFESSVAPSGAQNSPLQGQHLQRLLEAKQDGRQTSTALPKPDVLADAKVMRMLLEMLRRRGRPRGSGGHSSSDTTDGDGDQTPRAKSPVPRNEKKGQGLFEKVEELIDLLRLVTKQPTEDNVQQAVYSHCVPKHHVFFGKVHKTGSSTVANILQRYGFARQLNFVLPRRRMRTTSYNYITKVGEAVSHDKLIPPPLGEHYDILWNHGIYDSQFYHSILPADTVYVSILRQPLQQFQSAFEYYGRSSGSPLYTIMQENVSNPLSLYLQQPSLYNGRGVYTSYIRNKQSEDLGMRDEHVLNDNLRREYIQQLGKEFQLVMITEFFDESLVLLRRLMCWSVKDVLYIPKNKNVYKKKRVFSAKDQAKHRKLNVADYDLYNFFLKRFSDTVARQKPDFWKEVAYFKKLLQNVQSYCSQVGGTSVLEVPRTQWNAQFTVGPEDCRLMQKPVLPFLNDLMVDGVQKYKESVERAKRSHSSGAV